MPFVLGYNDRAKDAIFSGGSWLATAPLSNVQTDDIQQAAISSDATAASSIMNIDLGEAKKVGMFVVGPVNLTEGAGSYRIRSYSDSAYTTQVYDTGTVVITGDVVDWSDSNDWLEWEDVNFWSGILPSSVSELPLYIIDVVPLAQIAETTQQWFKIELVDADNVDGRISVGAVRLFESLRPSLNYAPDGNEFSFEWLTDAVESLGGTKKYWRRGRRRRLRVNWPLLDEAELFSDFFLVGLKSGISQQVFVVPEEDDSADYKRRRAFLATFSQSPPIAQAAAGYGSTSLDLEEVI